MYHSSKPSFVHLQYFRNQHKKLTQKDQYFAHLTVCDKNCNWISVNSHIKSQTQQMDCQPNKLSAYSTICFKIHFKGIQLFLMLFLTSYI